MSAVIVEGNFEQKVMKSEKPVLADFYSNQCPPCKQLSPVLDELSEEFGSDAVVAKIDVEKNMETASEYGIMAVPTIILFQNGEIIKKVAGVLSIYETRVYRCCRISSTLKIFVATNIFCFSILTWIYLLQNLIIGERL